MATGVSKQEQHTAETAAPPAVGTGAIYQDGVLKPDTPLDLPEGTRVQLYLPPQVVVVSPALPPPSPTPTRWSLHGMPGAVLRAPLGQTGILASLRWLDMLVLAAGLLVYALMHLIGLTRFPIYFFCDEAIQANLASSLLKNGFRDSDGTFLPPYFLNLTQWNLSLSIYIHLISVALFGKSVFVTRATSAVVSMLAPIAVALTLKLVFHNRSWWLAPLVIAGLPAWFLHSRTAFETVLMVAFYSCFLCSYLLYRYHSPRYLFVAALTGAATFYSYSNGQGVMFVSLLLLLFADLPYHIRQIREHPRMILLLLLFTLVLAVPLIRFQSLHPGETSRRFQESLHSYLFKPIPASEKWDQFQSNYLMGLDPRYWFIYNYKESDLERHLVKGQGHLPMIIAPFVFVGVALCLWRWRSSAHRTLLIAMLAAPFSSALVDIEIYRVLAMMIPATCVTVLGLDAVLDAIWPPQKTPEETTDHARPNWFASPAARASVVALYALLLLLLNGRLLFVALHDGPTWYTNYTLGGMQYGAPQLFGEAVPDVLTHDPPDTYMMVSHTWANNPGAFTDFFLTPEQRPRVTLYDIEDLLVYKRDIRPNQLYVLTPYEYERATQSGKLMVSAPERTIPYPDGSPGFLFVRLAYVSNIDELFVADREARRSLVPAQTVLNGQRVDVQHSVTDMGGVEELFDGSFSTVMRGMEANPFVLVFNFSQPITTRSLSAMVRCGATFHIKVEATPADGGKVHTYEKTFENMPPDPTVEIPYPDGPLTVSAVRVEITNLQEGEVSHVHIFEMAFQ